MKMYRLGTMGGTLAYRSDRHTAIDEARTHSSHCKVAVTEYVYRDDLPLSVLVEAILNGDIAGYQLSDPTVVGCFENGQLVEDDDIRL